MVNNADELAMLIPECFHGPSTRLESCCKPRSTMSSSLEKKGLLAAPQSSSTAQVGKRSLDSGSTGGFHVASNSLVALQTTRSRQELRIAVEAPVAQIRDAGDHLLSFGFCGSLRTKTTALLTEATESVKAESASRITHVSVMQVGIPLRTRPITPAGK